MSADNNMKEELHGTDVTRRRSLRLRRLLNVDVKIIFLIFWLTIHFNSKSSQQSLQKNRATVRFSH